jgi:hypothetical protein
VRDRGAFPLSSVDEPAERTRDMANRGDDAGAQECEAREDRNRRPMRPAEQAGKAMESQSVSAVNDTVENNQRRKVDQP